MKRVFQEGENESLLELHSYILYKKGKEREGITSPHWITFPPSLPPSLHVPLPLTVGELLNIYLFELTINIKKKKLIYL